MMRPIEARLPREAFARNVPRLATEPRAPRRHLEGLLSVGAVVDKYRIEELVGTGGFGAVYRATHLLLRTTVAIKHLLPEVIERRPSVVAQLLEEARLAARIRHPNVVQVFDVTQTPSLTYVVMEFIDGQSLARLIESRGAMPADDVAAVGIDVAEGLSAGLAQGVLHRDVKPANILLGHDGRACVVDLGLACAVVESAELPRTRRTSVVGTRGYIAPEVFTDPGSADFRADIYSLGVTLDDALRGAGPRRARQPLTDGRAHTLARVLQRMTASDPASRMESYSAVIDALRAAREER